MRTTIVSGKGSGRGRALMRRPEPGSPLSQIGVLAVGVGVAALPFALVRLLPSTFEVVIPTSTYLTFHNIAEFFSALVLFSVFGVGWLTHPQSRDRRSLFLACAFLAVGLLCVMHALSFSGMPGFLTANTPTKASQYWIALRLLTAASFLGSAFVSRETPRWISRATLLPPALVLPGAILVLVSYFPELVPVTFDPSRGLTPFKVYTEYLIVAVFLLAVPAYILRGRRTRTPPTNRILLAIVLSAYAEMVFTTYRSVFDINNALGHLYYIAASALVYQEVFIRSVREPYSALTAERAALEKEIVERVRVEGALRASQGQLALHRDHLEDLVGERTAELRAAKEAAETANRAKSVFLANMSHELRTPLNAVLGFSHLMHNARDMTESQRENLDIITRSGEYLLSLINNVLDISKIESGRVELEESAVDPRQLLQGIASLMGVRAREKGLDFVLEQSPDLPRCVITDAAKLRQVVLNLIANAIKYTARGTIMLRAEATACDVAGQVRLGFHVADTGPGICEEDRQRIFVPFAQVGDQPAAEAGTGLGLAICKQFVELMGGEIQVAGSPGGGSVFSFRIPVRVIASEEEPCVPARARVLGLAEGQPRYRLLIVEDQHENRLLLRRVLEPVGFELREAVDGAEAIAVWEEWRPHLVFMDVRMPVMDGLEATRRILAADIGARTKIVAVTAHALEQERQEILSAGCDDFIRKPYGENEVFDALTRQLGARFRYEASDQAGALAMSVDEVRLAGLPEELTGALERALVDLDVDAVDRAVDEIRADDPHLADALADLVADLQLGLMLRLIRVARDGTRSEGRT